MDLINPADTITIKSLLPSAKIVQGPFFKRRSINFEKGMQRSGITFENGWKWERHGFSLRLRRIKKLRIVLEENKQYWTGYLIQWYRTDESIPLVLSIEKEEISNGIHEIVVKDENNQRVPQKIITIGRINYVPQDLEDIETVGKIIATVMTPLESLA